MASSGIEEASEVIRRFIAHTSTVAPMWRELTGTTDDSLWARIRALLLDPVDAEAALRPILDQVRSPGFGYALQLVATQGGVPGAEQRQWRNVQALLLTALVASAAKRIQNERGEELPAQALTDLEDACRLFNVPIRFLKTENMWKERPATGDACDLVRRGLLTVQAKWSSGGQAVSLAGCAAARYWINSKGNRPFIGAFRASSRPSWHVATLIEHPTIALLCLGPLLVDSIASAWSSAGEHTAVWRIDGHSVLAQDDESMSGAAAVVFHALADNATLGTNVLVLGRVYNDGRTLAPVGAVREKIEALLKKDPPNLTVLVGNGRPVPTLHADTQGDDLHDLYPRARFYFVGNLIEAMTHASGRVGVSSGSKVGVYKLERQLSESPGSFELWEASHGSDAHLLLKLWHVDARQQLLMRASWDRELRTLYRVCSLPHAEELLLAISDSFIDEERFALIMRTSHRESGGPPHTLENALKARSAHHWLETESLHSAKGRCAMWRGLRRIAEGIRLLHSQNVVHRNLSAECVFYSGTLSDESLRLGGFEWSARVGASQGKDKPSAWAAPPLATNSDTTIDTDWYGFGMLAARCFFDLESFDGSSPHELNARVMAMLSSDERSEPLLERERSLIQSLVEPDRAKRLKEPARIAAAIERVIGYLSQRAYDMAGYVDPQNALYVICNSKAWDESLASFGFDPGPLPLDERDAALKMWLKKQFASRTLYRMPNDDFWLQGEKCALRLLESRMPPGWTFAFADALESVGIPDRATSYDLTDEPIEFLLTSDNRRNYPDNRNWQPYLPPKLETRDDPNQARETLVRFLRCTNQLDLLLCYGEIFPCQVEPIGASGGMERVRLTPRIVRDRVLPAWLRNRDESEMIRHFQARLDSSSIDAKRVVLTTEAKIRLTAAEARRDEWLLDARALEGHGNGDSGGAALVLMRPVEVDKPKRVLPHGPMYVRARDHFGQVELIDRRGKAIDQMGGFRYLLNALASPKPMSTKLDRLPLGTDPNRIDGNKRSVLHDILSARPIYALQGPPGTGKTTLIAHLARQILTEDQTAQILITAQAHGAVQRLQETLGDAFSGDDEPPLTIRLGIDDEEELPADAMTPRDSNEAVSWTLRRQTVDILEKTKEKLAARAAASGVEAEWLKNVQLMLDASRMQQLPAFSDLAAFERLIRDGANIVFCTTSAGDLEEIAGGDKTFDWSIVEEAGKVHGYDLALPMNVGHRWLLVGDQRQLKAYRYEDFVRALDSEAMEESTALLRELHHQNPDVVDREWLQQWSEMKSTQDANWTTDAFLTRAKAWLKTFDYIYKLLQATTHEERVTEDHPVQSAVGRLTNQYRMHPAIGQLVSETYYWETVAGGADTPRIFVKNQTGSIDEPLPKVLHSLSAPDIVQGKPIVWLDVPWCRDTGMGAMRESGTLSYWNRAEIDLVVRFCRQLGFDQEPAAPLKVAVLSTYTAQKEELEKALRKGLPNGYNRGLTLKEGLYGRQRNRQKRFTHTVDSFQGNEADVIVVSFTRNNTKDRGKGLGFVAEANRMNVLLSRAQRLLVLVGSWDFFQHQVGDIKLPADQRHNRAHVKRMLEKLDELGKLPQPAFVRVRWDNGAFRVVNP